MTAHSLPGPRTGFPSCYLVRGTFLSHSAGSCVMLSVKTLFEHAPSIPIYVISGFLGSGTAFDRSALLAALDSCLVPH